jgi:hypothetical protein
MALANRRLKISEIHELNDPFELLSYDLSDDSLRASFLKTREEMNQQGLLCFSESWSNPVMWAHYSDNHKGLCLGFEIPDPCDGQESVFDIVKYAEERPVFPANFGTMPDDKRLGLVRDILFTKFNHWSYEKEVRAWTSLEDKENGRYFMPFSEKLKLAEVILGEKCDLSKAAIQRALGEGISHVKITLARPSHNKFEMVEADKI